MWPVDIDTFNHAPKVTTLNSVGLSGAASKTVTLTIDKTVVNARPNNGVSSYQICYQSDVAFTDRSGNTVTLGLLPDCPTHGAQPPCVLSKNKTGTGNVVIVILVPLSDPKFW